MLNILCLQHTRALPRYTPKQVLKSISLTQKKYINKRKGEINRDDIDNEKLRFQKKIN